MLLKDSGEKLSIKTIEKVEKELNIKFPQEYINFMLEHNGGRPLNPVTFSFIEEDPETHKSFENNSDIHTFNQMEDIPTFYDNLISAEVIPKHYCPIANDSCGNEIVICLDNSEYHGILFFADHELCDSEEHWILSKIANNFIDFVNLFKTTS
ncbi:hypothetical protein PIROE2DRAFT_14830 [Piromyces sp. E2]|nr:hypothetical protein PIROE2DRAFT_14830 [Piromyces sp. E2]|eukprot:OUM59584.1 hypothetical protein PIROE2DRAFT_14830 [Piromyces sp. E2]